MRTHSLRQVSGISLEPLDLLFSVCKVTDYTEIDIERPFVFTGRTEVEKSLVCPTGIVPQNIPMANTTSHVGKITIEEQYNAKFILYVLSSQIGYNQFWEAAAKKTTRPELSIDEIKAVKVVLPPTKREQDEIVDYLDQRITEIDSMISKKQEVITDLESYKRSLIFETVTGKRKVV